MTAVYGQTVYNTDVYTGTDPRTTNIWAIEIDWDNDGSFDGSNEAGIAVDLYSRRGRPNMIDARGEGLEPFQPGKCVVTLENDDGRFDPYNASGPLYGQIYPGRLARVRVKNNGTFYPIIFGKVASIKPISQGNNEKYVQIEIEDGIRILKDRKISVGVQTSQLTHQIISTILTAADWPTAWGSDLDTAAFTLPYWWADNESAWKLLHELMYFEGQAVFIAADGELNYRGVTSDTLVESFDESELGKDLRLLSPWDVWRNYYTVEFYPVVERSATEIWRLNDDSVQVGAGQTVYLWAEFSYDARSVSADNLITPVATTDYTANATQGGGGTDYTANMDVSIVATFGQSAKLAVENTGGAAFYITLLKLRGDAYDQPNASRYEEDNISGSGVDDRLDLNIDYKFMATYNDAYRQAGWYMSVINSGVRIPTFSIDSIPSKQFLDVFDHIRVRSDTLGLSQVIIHVGTVGLDYRVGYIEHNWQDSNGEGVLTSVICEPYITFIDPR